MWCVLFALWFRNRPEEKKTVNAAELALIGEHKHAEGDGHAGVPWRRLLTSGNLWSLCLMYFCAVLRLVLLHHLLLQLPGGAVWGRAASLVGWLYKGGPLLIGALACLTGGVLTDRFIRRRATASGAGGCSACAATGCARSVSWLSLAAPTAFWFFVARSLASFFNDMTMGSAWATCQDIGRRYAAIVAGCMNTIGNLGGAAAGYLTGEILQWSVTTYATAHGLDPQHLPAPNQAADAHTLGYQVNLISFAFAYLIAMLLWLRVDSTKPVVGPDPAAPPA